MIDFLDGVVKGEILDDEATRKQYSVDASIFEVTPHAVIKPTDADDLKRLINAVRKRTESGKRTYLAPRAGGTCMSGGSLTPGLMVDVTRGFNWIADFDTEGKKVWVGSGTYHRDLAAAAATRSLLFAPYTSSKDICAIGGMVGNNASGEKSLRYGATVDNVNSVRMVCFDGNEYEFGPLTPEALSEKLELTTFEGHIYREVCKLLDSNQELIARANPKVRKNSAGYSLWRAWNQDRTEFNLAKVLVGSQGTLGVITAAELKLVDLPQHTRMLVVPIQDLSQLAKVVKVILTHRPEGLETYDHHTYEFAQQFMPQEAAAAKSAAGQHMVVFAQFAEHDQQMTDHNARVCQEALERQGYAVSYIDQAEEAEAHWKIRRASFKLLKDHAHGTSRAVPFIEDTIVSIDHYGEFLAALESILADYDMTYTYAGHIGDGSIRLIPLVDLEKPGAPQMVFDLARRTYELTFAFGGSMSVDHNDGIIRTPFLERMYGKDVMRLFAATKFIFDPLNIFNPGKKIAGTEAFALNHMSRTNTNPVL